MECRFARKKSPSGKPALDAEIARTTSDMDITTLYCMGYYLPVAPKGCPLEISPPLGLTTYLPP